MMTYIKARPWHGKALDGAWLFTIKRDGVRAIWNGKEWRSRADKPLYNIPPPLSPEQHDVEVFVGSFRDTIRATRTQHLKDDTPRISYDHLFSLRHPDPRNYAGVFTNPSAALIYRKMRDAIKDGQEGLVLRSGDAWIKVKPAETIDLLITGAIAGQGQHLGRLGAVITQRGAVGAGFSDEEREDLWAQYLNYELIGQTVECEYMHLTPDGQMRHPRFVRMRPDKIADE
jgi:ATP-dependent DNA ligase